jgi:phosphoserine phosphatase
METETIAVVFDFDDTLAPDSVTRLVERQGVDPEIFWKEEFTQRVRNGFDPTIATLSLLTDEAALEGSFGELTKSDLTSAGESLEQDISEGVTELLNDFDEIAEAYDGVTVNTYIISEGLKEVIEATTLADEFEAVYASELSADEEGTITGLKRAISFTDKTRYLFEINKGISQPDSENNPYKVNEKTLYSERTIPFENIVYVGDGLTDIPCFSLVQDRNGRAFGVYDSENRSTKQEAVSEIGSPQRTLGSSNKPSYKNNDRLGSILRLTVEGMCADRTLDELEVEK